ncbi:MAG: right-handed parallel beta-helix repeat-containing protein [Actinobacteria bacterium]|nr:right-handed parallel beta-helix repeat-containing protein [Actinomycetota bacterium]
MPHRRQHLAIHLAFISFVALWLVCMFAAPAQAANNPLYVISDVAGGDCSFIGSWNFTTKTCTVTQEITVDTGYDAGIVIASPGVTLDGNNHSLKGQGSGTGNPVGVEVSVDSGTIGGVTVRNLVASGFDSGITLQNCSNCTVTNNTFSGNGYGMQFYRTTNSQISGNSANDNNIYSFPITGIYLSESTGNEITGNYAAGNGNNIELVNFSDGNVVSGNFFTLSLDPTGSPGGGNGVSISQSSSNTLINNVINYNGTGLAVSSGSNGNIVKWNDIRNNFIYGLTIDSSDNNEIYNNNFIDNATQATCSGTGNIFNRIAPTGGNYWSNWTTPDTDHNGFVDSPFTLSGGSDSLPWAAQYAWLDTTAPVTSENAPAGWSSSDVTVNLSCVDNISGTGCAATFFTVDSGSVQTGTNAAVSGEGVHTLSYYSVDLAGNAEAAKTAQVRIDMTGTSITGIVPSGVSSSITAYVEADYADTLSGATSPISATMDVVTPLANCVTTSASHLRCDAPASIADGLHTFFINMDDNAGNTGSGSVSWRLDTTKPQISNMLPLAGSITSDTLAEVRYDYSDSGSGMSWPDNVYILIDWQSSKTLEAQGMGVNTITATSFIFVPSASGAFDDGVHNVSVYACDQAGNCVDGVSAPPPDPLAHWTFTVDTTGPAISNVQPGSGFVTITGPTIEADLADGGAGVNPNATAVALDGQPLAGCSRTAAHVSCPTSGLAQGNHGIEIISYDLSGNANVFTGAFFVDSVSPGIANLQPAGTIATSSTIISATLSDPAAGSGIDTSSTTVSLDGQALTGCTVSATDFSCPVSGLAEGAHTIGVSISDSAGNTVTAGGDFIVSLPAVSRDYYWARYDGANSSDYMILGNPPGTGFNLKFDLFIGGEQKDISGSAQDSSFTGEASPGQSLTPSFPGLAAGGPVRAVSTTGDKAIASQRILWKGRYFEEVPGTEAGQLSSHYLWTWYDEFSPGFDQDEVIVVNPTSDHVRVDISFNDVSGGTPVPVIDSRVLDPAGSAGDSWSFSYEGKMGGPVEVKAYRDAQGGPPTSWENLADRSDIIATQRVIKDQGLPTEHLSEVRGTPADQLSSRYYWTWYDWNSPGAQNYVLAYNPGPDTVKVHVSFTDESSGQPVPVAIEKVLAPGDAPWTPFFPGMKGGPVEVRAESTTVDADGIGGMDPRNIIASQRSVWTSFFEEVPGIPQDQLSSRYLWTWYDWKSIGSQNWVMVANPNNEPVDVSVSFINLEDGAQIGGAPSQLSAAGTAGSIAIMRYDGRMGGPLEVKANISGGSWSNQAQRRGVIASQRVLWNGQFNETLGTVID